MGFGRSQKDPEVAVFVREASEALFQDSADLFSGAVLGLRSQMQMWPTDAGHSKRKTVPGIFSRPTSCSSVWPCKNAEGTWHSRSRRFQSAQGPVQKARNEPMVQYACALILRTRGHRALPSRGSLAYLARSSTAPLLGH